MKYTRNSNNSNIRTGLAISEICDHFQLYFDITDICLYCYSHSYARFRCIFDGLCASKKKYLFPPTDGFMRNLCVYFYITLTPNFFSILNPFSNQFKTAVLNWLYWNNNYGELKAHGNTCFYTGNVLNRAIEEEHHPREIVQNIIAIHITYRTALVKVVFLTKS